MEITVNLQEAERGLRTEKEILVQRKEATGPRDAPTRALASSVSSHRLGCNFYRLIHSAVPPCSTSYLTKLKQKLFEYSHSNKGGV